MGGIITGVIGGIGSLVGGNAAAKQALAGFNYLRGKQGVQPYVDTGKGANSNVDALLNGGPNSPAAKAAYANYLNSTGYNFQLKQGTNAITGSAAARGILNSGSTGKALTKYGQDLASTTFNNYLSQEGTLADRGLVAAKAIGEAGTQGGATAAQATAGGIAGATGAAQNVAGKLVNYFGGV